MGKGPATSHGASLASDGGTEACGASTLCVERRQPASEGSARRASRAPRARRPSRGRIPCLGIPLPLFFPVPIAASDMLGDPPLHLGVSGVRVGVASRALLAATSQSRRLCGRFLRRPPRGEGRRRPGDLSRHRASQIELGHEEEGREHEKRQPHGEASPTEGRGRGLEGSGGQEPSAGGGRDERKRPVVRAQAARLQPGRNPGPSRSPRARGRIEDLVVGETLRSQGRVALVAAGRGLIETEGASPASGERARAPAGESEGSQRTPVRALGLDDDMGVASFDDSRRPQSRVGRGPLYGTERLAPEPVVRVSARPCREPSSPRIAVNTATLPFP